MDYCMIKQPGIKQSEKFNFKITNYYAACRIIDLIIIKLLWEITENCFIIGKKFY